MADRPGVVWVFTIFISLGIIWQIFGGFLFFGGLGSMEAVPVTFAVLELLLLIPQLIMIVKFFKLQKSAIPWVHFSYGGYFILGIARTIVYFATAQPPLGIGMVAPPSFLAIALYVIIWWAVVDYVKKKEINSQKVFT